VEVVVTAGTMGRAKLQPNHHHQQTNTMQKLLNGFSQNSVERCHTGHGETVRF